MKFFELIASFFKTDEAPPPARMGITPHPLTINPTDQDRLNKTRLRLERCRQALAEATDPAYKALMVEAIARHAAALRAAGVKEP